MRQTEIRFPINRNAFLAAMRGKGFRSVDQLSKALGVHRNTLSSYLQGANTLPKSLARALSALELSPAQAFEAWPVRKRIIAMNIAPLIESLNTLMPQAALVLFGSRARGNPKQYSDYDLGVYRSQAIAFSELSPLLTQVADFNAQSLFTVQLTNLSDAHESFLGPIADDLLFLGGSFLNWISLLKKAGVVVYE